MADYIDRAELMKFPIRADHYDKEHGNKHFISGIETVLEYAGSLPAADVAPVVHGRWTAKQGGFFEMATCSVCGERHSLNGGARYCPHCGAKMEVDHD